MKVYISNILTFSVTALLKLRSAILLVNQKTKENGKLSSQELLQQLSCKCITDSLYHNDLKYSLQKSLWVGFRTQIGKSW